MDEEQVIKALLHAAPGIRNGNYAALASMVFFLYDWAISIDLEVRHFWKKKISVGALLYFGNRAVSVTIIIAYYQITLRPLDQVQTNKICFPFLYILAITTALSTAVIQSVLALRTYALWDCSRRVLYTLMLLIVGGFAGQLVVMGLRAPSSPIVFNPFPAPYTGCISLTENWIYQRYIPIIIFEIPAAVLMLCKFGQYIRRGTTSRIAHVIYRDGFAEFTIVTVSSIFSLFVELYQPPTGILFNASLTIVPAVGMVCCARMLLNIRDVMSLSDPSLSSQRDIPHLDPVSNEFVDTEGRIALSGPKSSAGSTGNVKNRHLDSFREDLGMESWELQLVSGT